MRAGRWIMAGAVAAAVVLLFPGALPARSQAAPATTAPPFLAGEGASATGAAAVAPAAASLPAGFTDTAVFSGLTNPTNVRFASDGRVFVAEKSGLLVVFDSLADQTPTVVADLQRAGRRLLGSRPARAGARPELPGHARTCTSSSPRMPRRAARRRPGTTAVRPRPGRPPTAAW